MTIYEYSKFANDFGFDIGDVKWDFGMYLACPEKEEECEDGYDKLMFFIANNIKMEGYSRDWYSPCYISEFINKYRPVFESFLNDEYIEGYRPMDYSTEELDIVEEDSIMIDVYLPALQNLAIGNFASDSYDILYNMLVEYKAF